MTKAVVAQRDQEQIALQRQLQNAGKIEKNNRQTAAAVERQIAEVQKTIASQQVELSRSISINGLDEHTTRAVMTFKDRLSHGEDLKTAALSIAGYELPELEAALAQRDRDEMRAFDALPNEGANLWFCQRGKSTTGPAVWRKVSLADSVLGSGP